MRACGITVMPSGFCHADAILGQELVGRNTRGGRQSCRLSNTLFQAPSHRCCQPFTPGVLRHIQVRFVERQGLDQRCHRSKEPEHLL